MRNTAPFAATALLLLALSCTSEAQPPPTEPDDQTTTTDPVPEVEAPDTEPEPEDATPGEDELATTWEAFHTAWMAQAAEDEPDPAAFNGLTTDPAGTVELLQALRADGQLVTTDQELWPRFDIQSHRADITDCAILTQHPTGQPDSAATTTISWDATAVIDDDGWRIDTAQPGQPFCIAEELNDQLIAAYEAFRTAKDAAWDPPDPDHPDLERTMAGEQLTFIRDLLTEHQREGIVIREPAPTDNAVVFEVGIGQATVSDCTEQVDGYGAFDLSSGERLDELIAPVSTGRLDAQSVELERQEGGGWVVVSQAASRDVNCEPGSSRYAVR